MNRLTKLSGLFFIFGIVLFLGGVPPSHAAGKEKTPESMLRAIKQRNEELDKKAKKLTLKEQRLRILDAEVKENLKTIKKLREEMGKIKAEQEAAAARQKAEQEAAAAKQKAEKEAMAAKQKAEKEERARKTKAGKEDKEDEDKEKKTVNDKESAEQKALQEQQLSKLAKLYEGMPPADAASRLQKVKDEFAMGIIRRMKEKKASKVLSAMDPVQAAKYTEKMAR